MNFGRKLNTTQCYILRDTRDRTVLRQQYSHWDTVPPFTDVTCHMASAFSLQEKTEGTASLVTVTRRQKHSQSSFCSSSACTHRRPQRLHKQSLIFPIHSQLNYRHPLCTHSYTRTPHLKGHTTKHSAVLSLHPKTGKF